MVKPIAGLITALAAFATLAVADNCQPGLKYCGYNLLKRGNYFNQIDQALEDNHQPVDANHINYSFFNCLGGDNGDIEWLEYCPGCIDGGSNDNDRCPP